ncbi:MAG: hypothetical protein QOG67_3449 [Verrucomicrobiota bacterium]|jgi:signal transduction histidine kinase
MKSSLKRRGRPSALPAYLRYGIAILSVAAAFVLKLFCQHANLPFPFTTAAMFAVAFTVWYAGIRAGLFGAAVSALALWFFVEPPSVSTDRMLWLTNHSVAMLLVVWITAALRRAELLLEQARHGLEVKVQERTAELRQANKELKASEQVARGQVEALAFSLDVLTTSPAPNEFVGQMLSMLCRLLGGQIATLALFDEARELLVPRFVVDSENPAVKEPEHPLARDPSSWRQNRILQELVFTGSPVVCEDIETDPRISPGWAEYFRGQGTKKLLAVPTLIGGEVKGVLGVRHGARVPYRPEETELTQALAHQVMVALRLTELGEQSQKAAILEERNRMARDVHDTLAQGFTGVILQLEAAQDATSCHQQEEANEHLERAAGLARQSLVEARRSVHALRPDALERDQLWDALQGIIKRTTAGTALHTAFELRGELPDLPPIWQENLLHIGQEALSNTLKYARAQNFRACLSCNDDGVRLELSDDGAGFEITDGHGGLGLTGMRERVQQMDGDLQITTAPGEGTNVVVILPVPAKKQSSLSSRGAVRLSL